MAIVKMKKLRVVAMADRREELLEGLLYLGCVEITEPGNILKEPVWESLLRRETSRLVETKQEITAVNTALSAIKKYAQAKDGMFVQRRAISAHELMGEDLVAQGGAVTAQISELLRELTQLQGEESRLAAGRASLLPWAALDMPLEMEGTAHTRFLLGTFPGGTDMGAVKTELAAGDAAAELYEISGDQQLCYTLLICYQQDVESALEVLRPHGFSVTGFQDITGTAGENLRELERLLGENRQKQDAAVAGIVAKAEMKDLLQVYLDRLCAEESKHIHAERLLTDGTILFFEGWAPAEKLEEVKTFLEKTDCAWEAEDPVEEEYPEVPVQLKNNWFTRPLNMVTEMYSLPAYNGMDPNPLMAPFFIFFYGFMMADMGYGLLMILASLYVMKKAKPNGPTMRHMIPLLGLCGVSTFIMGALTGGFFGDLIPQLVLMTTGREIALPALFSPLDDALSVLIGSLAIGVAQIFTGMGISMYKQIKRGEVLSALCNEGAWYAVFILFAVGLLAGQLKICGILIAVILVVTQSYGKKGIIGKVMGIGGSLYNNITGYFSDILSYSRLMALMLAGAVIAQVFNTLGGITGNVITFFIIAMIGNALNFALNLLGCYVHDMRLQCLEFFGRFYEDGGKPFRPLAIDAKHVDIVNK